MNKALEDLSRESWREKLNSTNLDFIASCGAFHWKLDYWQKTLKFTRFSKSVGSMSHERQLHRYDNSYLTVNEDVRPTEVSKTFFDKR